MKQYKTYNISHLDVLYKKQNHITDHNKQLKNGHIGVESTGIRSEGNN